MKIILLSCTAVLLIFQSFSLHTTNDWQPDISQIEMNSKKTWVVQLILSEPIDRFHLSDNCGNSQIVCSDSIVNSTMDKYVKSVMKSYIQLAEIK